jgi:hypothetical protein
LTTLLPVTVVVVRSRAFNPELDATIAPAREHRLVAAQSPAPVNFEAEALSFCKPRDR